MRYRMVMESTEIREAHPEKIRNTKVHRDSISLLKHYFGSVVKCAGDDKPSSVPKNTVTPYKPSITLPF